MNGLLSALLGSLLVIGIVGAVISAAAFLLFWFLKG